MYRGRGPVWKIHHYDLIVITSDEGSSRYRIGDVVTKDLEVFKGIVSWFEENHHRLACLVNTYIEYDMPMLVYTHATMNRRLARLKKLLTILGSMIINTDSVNIPLWQLYPIQLFTVKEVIDAMELVKNEVHRIRDKTHQLLYPRLLNALEGLMDFRIWYHKVQRKWAKGYDLHAYFEYNKYLHRPTHTFKIYFPKTSRRVGRTVGYSEFMELINKILERKERGTINREPKQALHLLSTLDTILEVSL